jgi:AbrB family looped-hinge helix DNA binding protein
MGYRITEKGTVTIPVDVRRRLGLGKGALVDFVSTDEGVLIVPVIPFAKLYGIDRDRKKVIYKMIRELHEERRREALEEG